jgi:hypothetical protein
MSELEHLYNECKIDAVHDSNALLSSLGFYPYSSMHLTSLDHKRGFISHRTALLSSDMAWVQKSVFQSTSEERSTPVEALENTFEDENMVTNEIVDVPILTPESESTSGSLSLADIGDFENQVTNLKIKDIETKDQNLSSDDAGSINLNHEHSQGNRSHKKKKKMKKKNYKLKDIAGLSPYCQWLLSLNDPDFEAKKARAEERARKKKVEADAKKSVRQSDAIISESLAEILAAQGHKDRAKKMYSLLMHKYPEKISYFAAKIENL